LLRYPLYSAITSYYRFFFSSRRRHTRSKRDWSSDVCSSDLNPYQRSRWIVFEGTQFQHIESFPIVFTCEWSPELFGCVHAQCDEIGRASCRERVMKTNSINKIKTR